MAACGICFEPYDASARPPLLSPCGHTVCGDCVARLNACPFCRLRLPANRALPCNFALLEVMDAEKQSEGAEERLLRQHGVLPAAGGSANGKDAAAGMPSALVLPAEELQLTTQDLGVGGTGRVVLGYLRGREVAVKLLPLSGCPPAAREALQREVRLLARVSASCRHTVKLLGISVKEGRLALVMRRCRTSLADHLREQEGGCLAPGAALLLAQDLLRGLAELHALGVVMADLKPDNVLLDESGAPLLCDFGLGRAVSATIGPHGGALVTSPAGSINYMAPEQFAMLEGDALTPQSDLWGFGCTLLHVMTGRPPWAGLNIGQITMQVGVNRRTPQLPPGLSPALHALFDSCLRPNPQERPSAAMALSMLVRELERQLHGLVALPKVPAAGGAAAMLGTGSAAAVPAARLASSVPPADPPPQPEMTAKGQLMSRGQQGLQVPPPAVQQVQLLSHQPSTVSAAAAQTHPTAGGPAGAVRPQEAVLPVHHHQPVVQLQEQQQLPQPVVQLQQQQQQAAPQQALQQTQLPQPPLQALFQRSNPAPTTYQPQLQSLQQLLQAPQQQSQQLQPLQQQPQQPQQAQQVPPPPPQQQQPSALLIARELYRQSVRQVQAQQAPPAQLPLDRATVTPQMPPAAAPSGRQPAETGVARSSEPAAIVAPLQQQATAGLTAAAMQTQFTPRHPVPAAPRLAPNPQQSALPNSSSQPPTPALPPPPEQEEWPALSVAAARRQPQQPRQQQHSEPPQVQQQQQQEQQAVVAAAAAVQETTRDDELVQRWARLYKRKSLSLKVYLVSPSDLRVRKPELATLMTPIESAELEEGGCGGGGGWTVRARLKLDALLDELHGKLVVPRPCRRYLLLKARRHELKCKELTELTEAEIRGPPGLLLVSFVDKGQEEPTPRELYVMDTRAPKLRVPVMLHGRWGAVRVEDVEVDATMSSTELGVKAAALLPPGYQQQHRGGFEPLLCGVRYRTGRLVLCEDLAGLGLFPGGVCHMRGYGRHPLDQGGGELLLTMRALTGRTFILPAWRDTVVEEVKEQVQVKEGIPPDMQRLVWSGQQLDDYRTLGDYGIEDGGELAITLRMRGGKPVICLWPAQPTDVRVGLRLSDRWTLSSLVPRPDSCGGGDDSGGRCAEWQVRALPGGTLVHPGSGDREYAYLFWEALTGGAGGGSSRNVNGAAGGGGGSTSLLLEAPALLQKQQQQQPDAIVAAAPRIPPGLLGPTPPDLPLPDFDPSRSFCVAGADVENWLYDALAAFGVPMRERTDFLTYWLPHMEGAAWLLLAFADPADYQAAAELRVQPTPDAALRLFMMFERLPAPLPAAAAVSGCLAAEVARLGGPLRREGAALAMLEWGGMEVVRPRSRRQQQAVLLAGGRGS